MDDLYLNRHAQQEPAPVKAGFVRNSAYSRHSEYSRHSREGGNPSLLAITTATRMQTCLLASFETEREKVYG
jgi:hypothetical protein